MAGEVPIIIADEPTGNLTRQNRKPTILTTLFKEYRLSSGKIVQLQPIAETPAAASNAIVQRNAQRGTEA